MRILGKKYKLHYLFILCFFIACKSEKKSLVAETSNEFSEFPTEENIVFKNVFEFKKGIPYNLHLKDSNLIIFNAAGSTDFFFYNYNLNSEKLSDGYLRGGRGPSEAIGGLSNGLKNNMLWMQDITLKKMLTLDLEKLEKEKTPTFNEYPLNDTFYSMDFKDSANFMGVGYMESKYKIQKVAVKQGSIVNEFGEFTDKPEDTKLGVWKSANECFIRTSPNGEKSVLFYRYKDEIEIYNNVNGNKLSSGKGPDDIKLKFESISDGDIDVATRTEGTKFAYLGGTVTKDFIYLLYAGHVHDSEFRDTGKYVFVFDWEGNPVKKLVLDRYILTFTVSDDDKSLFAFDPNSGYVVKTDII